jgi:hypothetical protein
LYDAQINDQMSFPTLWQNFCWSWDLRAVMKVSSEFAAVSRWICDVWEK